MINSNWQTAFNQLDSNEGDFLQKAIEYLVCLTGDIASPSILNSVITRLVAQIDDSVSAQLSYVLHHNDFQHLEANWRSLYHLTLLPLNRNKAKLKLLDMSWNEISNDINQSYSLENTQLYNKIGNNELNTLGGEPFGCICIAYGIAMEIDERTGFDDIYTLELMAKLGEILLCPFILAVDDDFFAGRGTEWLVDTVRVSKILHSEDYQSFQILRRYPCSKFIGLALPKLLVREKYQYHQAGFVFNELNKPLLTYAVFAFASIVLTEFQRVSWFGFLKARQVNNGYGAVVNIDKTDVIPELIARPKLNIKLNDTKAKFYAEQGFIPLTANYLTEKVYFYGNNSLFNAEKSWEDQVLSQIQITLIACRIAHYLKAQSRNIIASTKNAKECQLYLQKWIGTYASNLATSDEAMLAKYPINSAEVSVTEQAAQGCYHCILKMVPQYHYDAIAVEVLLTTKIEQGEDD